MSTLTFPITEQLLRLISLIDTVNQARYQGGVQRGDPVQSFLFIIVIDRVKPFSRLMLIYRFQGNMVDRFQQAEDLLQLVN